MIYPSNDLRSHELDIAVFTMGNDEANSRPKTGGSIATKVKPKMKRPSLYRVLILNDDYTPMEFVVHVLKMFFNKDVEAATEIMLHVHHQGIGECGYFTYEIAETKVTQVTDFARKHQHPLQCVMEKNSFSGVVYFSAHFPKTTVASVRGADGGRVGTPHRA
jgi:ATP-dependent Clp protease adaptor protein ClpS